MANIDLNSEKWCELVFEGKNKAFGGYVIRQKLGFRHTISYIITILAIVLAFVLPKVIESLKSEDDTKKEEEEELVYSVQEMQADDLAEEEIEEEEYIEPIVQEVEPPKMNSTVAYVAPKIVEDEEFNEDNQLKSQEELQSTNVDISVTDHEGDDTLIEDPDEVEEFEEVVQAPVVEEKPYEAVEQMPQYPGGDAELMKFIYSKIVYPQVAAENGITGQVILRFVVTKDGSIGDIQIMRSPDPSLSNEAIRVVRMMPRWNPGRQNGVAVPVWFTLPVKFDLK